MRSELAQKKSSQPKKIWVVDDDTDYLRRFCSLLEKVVDGVIVVPFESAEDLLDRFDDIANTEYPDLLFVDVHLPKLSGVSLLEKLVEKGRRVPSVLMSHEDRAKLIREAGMTRATAFLVKPHTFDQDWTTLVTANINFALSRSANQDRFEQDQVTSRLKVFYSGINHDYRQPIVNALFALEDFQEYLKTKKVDGRSREYRWVRNVEKMLRQAAGVVEDVKLVTEDGIVKVVPSNVIIANLIRNLKSTWKESFHLLQVEKENGLTRVQVDRGKVTRTISNVVANSVKYARPNVPPECEIRFESCPDSKHFWRIVLTDNGRGIPPGNVASCGLPGFRADNVEGVKGSGKGLAMGKRHCNIHLCVETGEAGDLFINNRTDGLPGIEIIMRLPRRAQAVDDSGGNQAKNT